MEVNKKLYESYVKEITPVHSKGVNLLWAFLVGGLICVLGQFVINALMAFGVEKEAAMAWNQLFLIALSILLTGLNLFSKITKFAGAGTLVPITGFANSVAAPMLEYKVEGQVFGIGVKAFTISGPVILYGVFSTWILGILSYILGIWNLGW
ncbi:MAG TPA: SpoVA/SpoVAEb family sporulation membrane protein [Candidatus Lachnoclostridium pullistercoris]|uniref:SpoVA/SpoVAEb family sporulation membrane protein n=1 Tax=Candidatus Lachnoclostridium pullistercoris TaxID=2838632 RepID=A0A9D2PEM8_9FIRM|nr:SpoVA/SpoVAEb family sporulation membrane protein [Candidatus Lachnoclostridium pullistercoris]